MGVVEFATKQIWEAVIMWNVQIWEAATMWNIQIWEAVTMWNVQETYEQSRGGVELEVHVEGWNLKFTKLVGKHHPNIFNFVEGTRKEQAATEQS